MESKNVSKKSWGYSYEEKSYENILVHNILHKKLIDGKPLRIRVNKVDEIIKIYDGIRYLQLDNSYGINSGIYNAIFDKINYLISEKSSTTDSINRTFATISGDSFDSSPIEKMWTFHDNIILIKSVVEPKKSKTL